MGTKHEKIPKKNQCNLVRQAHHLQRNLRLNKNKTTPAHTHSILLKAWVPGLTESAIRITHSTALRAGDIRNTRMAGLTNYGF